MPLRTLPLPEFCDRVAARTPTPGGGSVAAAAAALGAALGEMAARFSETGVAPADVERLREARAAFLDLIDGDAAAYDRVSAALALPKGTAAEKSARQAALQEALRAAAEAPMGGVERAAAALRLLTEIRPAVNPNLATDLGSGAWLLRAAAESCALNVQVNLKSLKDEAVRAKLQGRLTAALTDARARHDALATS